MAATMRLEPRPGERAEIGDAEGEDGGEHDGVEEADGEDAPHGDVAEGEHGEQDQQAGDGAAAAPRTTPVEKPAQDGGADEAADHGASPVEGDVLGGLLGGEVADAGELEVADEEAADGDFGADRRGRCRGLRGRAEGGCGGGRC